MRSVTTTFSMVPGRSAKAKYYRLTTAGKAQLAREQDRWSLLVDAIGRVMNPAPASKE